MPNMLLIDTRRKYYLERCAADIMAANCAVNPAHAARCIRQAISSADIALNHTSNKTKTIKKIDSIMIK